MIPEIKPLSDESDILREASAVPFTATPHPQPPSPASANGSTPASPSITEQATLNTNNDVTPVNNGYDPSKIYGKEAMVRIAAQHPVDNSDTDQNFSYRLPRFSYVLTWIYTIAAIMLAILFFTQLAYIGVQASKVKESESSLSSYIYGYSKERIDESYKNLYLGTGLPLVVCIAMIVILLSGNRWFRYAGILIWIVIFGYLIYLRVKYQIDHPSSDSNDSGTTSTMTYEAFVYLMYMFAGFLVPFIPYAFISTSTLIYLLSPTASRAYR